MEKRSKKKYWILLIPAIFILFMFFYVQKAINELSEIGSSKEFSKRIEFREVDQSIFIKSKIWGLTGDHCRIFLSNEDKLNPNENKDIVFYELEIYYKQKGPDSLFIYVPSNVRKKDKNIQIGKITVSISSPVNFQSENYKQLGLSQISCYDGIE